MNKVLYIASSQNWYTRNAYLVDALNKKYHVDIIISKQKKYFFRIISISTKYIFNIKKYDKIYVGFLAQAILPMIKILYKGQITADFFISLYDTLCFDRKIFKPKSIFGKIIFKYEKLCLKICNNIIVDTEASKKFFAETFNLDPTKITALYVLPEPIFFQYPYTKKLNIDKTEIFYYGSGQALHGLDIILEAITLCEFNNFHFTLIGPIKNEYKKLLAKINPKNITIINWVPYEKILKYIAEADICLGGHFGNTDKAKRVIAGKTFQFMAMKKAVILSDTQANRELFIDNQDCVMTKSGDSKSLAASIIFLANNQVLQEKIASISNKKICQLLQTQLNKI